MEEVEVVEKVEVVVKVAGESPPQEGRERSKRANTASEHNRDRGEKEAAWDNATTQGNIAMQGAVERRGKAVPFTAVMGTCAQSIAGS